MGRKAGWAVGLGAVAVAVAAGWLMVGRRAVSAPATVLAAGAAAGLPQPERIAPRPGSSRAAPPAPTSLPASPPASPPGSLPASQAAPAPESLSARVAALARSGRPADAYAAYRLLAACDLAQNLERVAAGQGDEEVDAHALTVHEACADLSPGQLGQRVALLSLAAAAHVHGAVADLISQGPNGEPIAQVWDDPAYAEWKRQALEAVRAEAALGDPMALIAMNGQYDHGGTPDAHDGALAIQYWVAYADLQRLTDPRYADPARRRSFDQGTASIVARYSANLTPEQAAAAVAAGHAFASGFRPPAEGPQP